MPNWNGTHPKAAHVGFPLLLTIKSSLKPMTVWQFNPSDWLVCFPILLHSSPFQPVWQDLSVPCTPWFSVSKWLNTIQIRTYYMFVIIINYYYIITTYYYHYHIYIAKSTLPASDILKFRISSHPTCLNHLRSPPPLAQQRWWRPLCAWLNGDGCASSPGWSGQPETRKWLA